MRDTLKAFGVVMLSIVIGSLVVTGAILNSRAGGQPPAPQISAPPIVSDSEEDQPRFTGYYLEFPEGTEDWRIIYGTYSDGPVGAPFASLTQSYVCLKEGVWEFCVPAIRSVVYGDR